RGAAAGGPGGRRAAPGAAPRPRRRQYRAEARPPGRPLPCDRGRSGDRAVKAVPPATGALAAVALVACSGEGSRSPTCGLAQVAGPALIQQQLVNVPFVLTEAPRGLPASLPARVIGIQQQGEVRVT